jgi:hypothetical protein
MSSAYGSGNGGGLMLGSDYHSFNNGDFYNKKDMRILRTVKKCGMKAKNAL